MIYMVVPFSKENHELIYDKLGKIGKSVYANKAPAAWFVSYDGTTSELADEMQFGDEEEMGEAIIVRITNYQGYTSTSLWEWMEAYAEK